VSLWLPQIRDFDKLRHMLELVAAGHEHAQTIGEEMAPCCTPSPDPGLVLEKLEVTGEGFPMAWSR
jgi:hypothetical protein